MKKRCLFLALVVSLILATVACRFGRGDPDDQADPVSNQANSGEIFFQDDFSDESSGWYTFVDGEGVTDYQDGGFRIFVGVPNTYHWTNPEENFGDVQIEVDVTKLAGPEENDFGLICRYRDDANFYFFTISSDGYYGIAKFVDGEELLLGTDELGYDETAIRPGEATNHIRADCIGDTFTLYANGQQLTQVQDSDFASGDVGLIASTYEQAGTDMLFDNLVVRQP